jgi:molybdopterin-dependent oxidoreductase alpha subunit
VKKVLYTLQSARRIGVGRAAKALSSHNACKACGLGMGGQRGGMTNELGDFPAVCNKSVQAQLTDIQAPIPEAVFEHTLDELRQLDGHELEHLGRLDTPLHKAAGAPRFEPLSWDAALALAADRLRATSAARSFFYASGRSSNEAGFLLQLLARLHGANNVNNCSYYCHQATSVALDRTIGTGTATVELEDLAGCDLILLVGANPASNHPRFIHQLKACRERGGQVLVINPAREPGLVRFAVPKSPRSLLLGGTEIASAYLQPRIGSDIALFKGLAKALLDGRRADDAFIAAHTEGFDAYCADVEATSWATITASCGITRDAVEDFAARYGRSRSAVIAWGMGLTHHAHGVANVEQLANLALLRGMIGRPNAGLLPLRGHSNVQGIGTIGVKPVLPEAVFRAMEAQFGVALPRAPGMDTLACLEAAAAGAVDLALCLGGNLYGASPDTAWTADALDRIRSKIFLTTTLNEGHVHGNDHTETLVLPVTARDEEWEPTTQESMFNYLRLSDGGIHRLDGVRPEVFILTALGERALPDCPVPFADFRRHRTLRQAIAAIVPELEALADIDVARREFHVRNRVLHTPRFQTASGRARFSVRPLPTIQAAADPGAGRFLLGTVRSEGQFNTIVYERGDSYRQAEHRWVVFMSPQDMALLSLRRGDRVDVRSPQGVMRGVSVLPFDLPSGNLLAYFPEANLLTSRSADPESRTPAFKSTPVSVEAPIRAAPAADRASPRAARRR